MLSSHADPLLSMPPTEPWRAPVAPLSASAIVMENWQWKERYQAGVKRVRVSMEGEDVESRRW